MVVLGYNNKRFDFGKIKMAQITELLNKENIYSQIILREEIEELVKEIMLILNKVKDMPVNTLKNLSLHFEKLLELYGEK